jgi:hypothetical protein
VGPVLLNDLVLALGRDQTGESCRSHWDRHGWAEGLSEPPLGSNRAAEQRRASRGIAPAAASSCTDSGFIREAHATGGAFDRA